MLNINSSLCFGKNSHKMYALLRSISAPRKPKELNFTEIMDTLAQHVDPKPIIIAERYKFHKAEQEESETVRQYLAKLRGSHSRPVRLWFAFTVNSTQVTG